MILNLHSSAAVGSCCEDGKCFDVTFKKDCESFSDTLCAARTDCEIPTTDEGACCISGKCEKLTKGACDTAGGRFSRVST